MALPHPVACIQVAVEYEAYHHKGGLTLPGLRRTYDDGIGDVDTDYDTLGLGLEQVSLRAGSGLSCAWQHPAASHVQGVITTLDTIVAGVL